MRSRFIAKTWLNCLAFLVFGLALSSCVDDTTRPEKLAHFVIEPTSTLLISESGASETFTVALNMMPRSPVHVSIVSSDPGEGLVSPSSISFNALTYNKPQTITVTGVDDNEFDGNQTLSLIVSVSSTDDPRFLAAAATQVSVVNVDDEDSTNLKPSIIVEPKSITTIETGKSEQFSVKLGSKPNDTVTIRLANEDSTEGVVTPQKLSFSSENWNVAQIVTIIPVNDGIEDGDAQYNIVLQPLESLDAHYSALWPSSVKVTNTDVPPNSAPGFVVNPMSLVTYEGGSVEQFYVSLNSAPSSDVVIGIMSSNTSEGTVSPSSLTFTSSNWNEAQFVSVSPTSDDVYEGEVVYSIILKAAVSDDPKYNGLDPNDIIVTNYDMSSEPVSVIVAPTSGLQTTEDGGKATFSVSLQSQPRADVYIPIYSSDSSEGISSVNRIMFTIDDWNTAQTISIQGVDDDLQDGDVPYNILLGPALSDDPQYNGLQVSSVSVVNKDNEAPSGDVNIVVKPLGALVTSEGGASVQLSMQLVGEPTDSVSIGISVSDPSEGKVVPNTLLFTSLNWRSPQTVSVVGVNDSEIDGDQTFTLSFSVTSSDSRYNGFSVDRIDVTNKDDDAHTGESVRVRIMAANITSGNKQSYDPGHGIRIFKGIKPDIVLIQEFNYFSGTLRSMVDDAFGPDFQYYCGDGSIPNGVISRFPIIQTGAWKSNAYNNRDWDWAVIDLPGPRDLLVVSVHLHTDKNASEMRPLMEKIKAKRDEGNYFVVLGGDFNTSTRSSVISNMSSVFRTAAPYPVDQNGKGGTNRSRSKPYDWIVATSDWEVYEKPVIIGTSVYNSGLVFDSRVYTPLSEVDPVQRADSDASNMQHMAVIRDFEYKY